MDLTKEIKDLHIKNIEMIESFWRKDFERSKECARSIQQNPVFNRRMASLFLSSAKRWRAKELENIKECIKKGWL